MTKLVSVDDDPVFQVLIEKVAGALGLEYVGIQSVAAALTYLAEQPADIVVVDGLLADGLGLDVVTALSDRPEPRPKVVFLSAFFRDLRMFQTLRTHGVKKILHKPISVNELRLELESILEPAPGPAEPAEPAATTDTMEVVREPQQPAPAAAEGADAPRPDEERLGDLSVAPRIRLQQDEILRFNLDHRAGFVLAQIDGRVTLEDLFSLSGMSRPDTARILAQLIDQGVIGI